MSITDELREWAEGDALRAGMSLRVARDQALAITDRIDAAHRAALEKVSTTAFDEGFASADDWLADNRDAMAEHGWIELPRDADGDYVHVGDDMESVNAPHLHAPVEYIALTESGWEVDGDQSNSLRHHRHDTWERIIHDAIHASDSAELGRGSYEQAMEALVARCRALAWEVDGGQD